jgi:LPS sulfotransferase NodH
MKTVLCAPHLKVILLTRENVLRRYISKEVASLSGVWDMNVKDGGKSDKAEKIENAYKKMNFSVEEFYKYLARNDSVKAFAKEYLRQGPQECVELTYEQIFGKDRDKKLAQIWKLLGVSKPRKPLEGNTKHMNPQPLSEIVVNYDEMCKALKGTPYEKMAKG